MNILIIILFFVFGIDFCVDVNLLCDEFFIILFCIDSFDVLNDFVKCYNFILFVVFDCYVLFVIKFIIVRFLVFWFSEDIRDLRRERWRVERKWC